MIHKTVLISYRRTNIYHARAILSDLHQHGYDVFLDYEAVDSSPIFPLINVGHFAHFLSIITPSALEEDADLRIDTRFMRQLELAVAHKRNIVLVLVGFDKDVMQRFLYVELLKYYPHHILEVDVEHFDEAMDHLRTEILNTPFSGHIYRDRTYSIISNRRLKELLSLLPVTKSQLKACQHFEEAIINRNYDNPHLELQGYETALQLNPEFMECYVARGGFYLFGGVSDKAIADYTQAIHINPKYASAYYSRSAAYFQKREYDLAIADLNQTIQLVPEYAEAYAERGRCYLAQGDINRAIADYTEAIRFDPCDCEAYMDRAKAYFDKGDIDLAIEDYTQIIRLNPNERHYHQRGIYYEAKMNYDLALEDYNFALELSPYNQDIIFSRERLLKKK